MRFQSGITDQVVYFVAVDATDFTTRETGLTTFTVYRTRNGSAAAAMTTPTVTEVDAANTPGLYKLLLDEDMTIAAGNDSEACTIHVTHAGMAPVTLQYELYRPLITAGETLTVASGLASADITAISTDSTAADNLELQYDGTGIIGDTFPATQAGVGNLTSGTAAINTSAVPSPNGFVVTTGGTETNNEDSTTSQDEVFHSLAASAGNTDAYYIFDVGGNGVGVSVSWQGYVNSNGDSYTVHAWNWSGASWDQLGTIAGANGTTLVTDTFAITTSHTGTGSDLGKVRFRFLSADGTLLATDRIICSYAVVAQSVGYSGGKVWIDQGGDAGTEIYVNGVADNPSPLADALTIAVSLNLQDYHVSSDTTLTPLADWNNVNVFGIGYELVLGGFDYAGSHFFHASPVSGIATSTNNTDHLDLLDCIIGDVTVGDSHFTNCSFKENTLTLNGTASTIRLINCRSVVAGSVTPIVDFGVASTNHNLTVAQWQNGIEIHNFNAAVGGGTDRMSISGTGQLIIDASCDGGTINVRGQWKITDNSGGAVTIVKDDIATNLDAVLADTNELQGDWSNGGRLDLILDIIAQDTTTDIPTLINALENIAATDIVSAGAITTLSGAVVNVDTVDVTTTNTDMRGTDGANTATPPTAGANADAVWDEVQSGHTTAGTFGKYVDAEISGATAPTAGAVADAVWDEPKSGHVASGSMGDEMQSHALTSEIVSASAIDTELTNNHGAGSWASTGGGSGANTITVTVDDGTTVIESAKVRMTKIGFNNVTETDAVGDAAFGLDAGTWTVAITAPGHTFTPTTLVVSATAAITYSMTADAVISPPADVSMCRVTGYLESLTGVVAANANIKFRLVVPSDGAAKSERVISGRTITATTDNVGFLDVELQRNDLLTPTGTEYQVFAVDLGWEWESLELEAANYDIADLIV